MLHTESNRKAMVGVNGEHKIGDFLLLYIALSFSHNENMGQLKCE